MSLLILNTFGHVMGYTLLSGRAAMTQLMNEAYLVRTAVEVMYKELS